MWTKHLNIDCTAIDAFAKLSGDYNSLHMHAEQARTYSYRQRVAHGMLGVSLLIYCPLLHGRSIKKISGRFNRPIFINDVISINVSEIGKDSLLFSLVSSSQPQPVMTGQLTLGGPCSPATPSSITQLIDEKQTENTYEISELSNGLTESLRFRLSSALSSLADNAQVPLEMIPVLLSSTMVGMRLPGTHATYIDFNFEFLKEFHSDAICHMNATVNFISFSAGVIIETVAIISDETKIAQGKLTIKLQEPSKPLPSFDTIKSSEGSNEFTNKVALITGSSRGIGSTTAKLLAGKGAKVIVNFHSSHALAQAVVNDIVSGGGYAIAIQADVSDTSQVETMFETIAKTWGGVDILINNAVSDALPQAFQSLSWENIQKDIDVVIKGAFLCSHAAVAQMSQRGGGHIVNISTVYTEKTPPGMGKYVIAKSGLVGLSKIMAVDLKPKNIRVNVVCPSLVETDLSKGIPPIIKEKMRAEHPKGKFPTTLDVARAIASLLQTDTSTGQTIVVA